MADANQEIMRRKEIWRGSITRETLTPSTRRSPRTWMEQQAFSKP